MRIRNLKEGIIPLVKVIVIKILAIMQNQKEDPDLVFYLKV